MLPVAIECSIVATMIAKPTPGQLGAHRPLTLDDVGVDVRAAGRRRGPTRRARTACRLRPCACITPPVSTPLSTAALIEPAARIVLIARMWCSWPCSTPTPAARSTPSDVPNSDDSMSCVASALPLNSTSTQPCSTSATIGVDAPVWTTAGPATHRIRPPSLLTSRIRSAIWRTSSACGFSLDTVELMNPKSPSTALCSRIGQHDPHAARAADDLVALVHVAHRHGAHPRAVRHEQAAVHLRLLDRHPLAAEPDDASRGWSSSRSPPGTPRRPAPAG